MRKFFLCLTFVSALSCKPMLTAQQGSSAPPADSGPIQPPSQPMALPSAPPPPHTLMDGTPVKLRLSQTISSADAKVGQEIPFDVIEDVSVDGVAVLPKGSVAIGTVTEANAKKSMGRAGKLNMTISYARLMDKEKVALRAMKDSKGGGHVGAMTGAIVATSIVFFPAAPLFLFVHGKDITIPQGTEITAFVQGDMHLEMSRFNPAQDVASSVAAPSTQTNLQVSSTPPGADIEIDGSFVGNSPSTVPTTNGAHEITLRMKGFAVWTRKMMLNGGAIHLNAELEAAPAQ